ncbi:uroporphyrinogen-III synthase [Arhodomonas aquaeolei]|uniref:uroporphyrinogen-III synthase n=1 Tax=Arhodomonas aquaeolei TaxID=2369 RepID=UPI00037ED240|nr:uroporphyrinogen-III synthase [Arhodomonas aquaeolei]
MNEPLRGVTVALPESRQLALFARMLEERGATTWPCPLVGIEDTPDRDAVVRWLDDVAAEGLDWLLLLTGEGLYRLLDFAEREGRRDAFVGRLETACKLTRGPKPARALRAIGLRADVAADTPTTTGVIATLEREALEGRRVGVQLYGAPNPQLLDYLAGRGAVTLPVAPYVYTDAARDDRVVALVDGLAEGGVDVLAFTSKTQVERLFACAAATGREAALARGLAATVIAAVGPVVAETLSARGFPPALVPADSYFMKPLVREIVAHVGGARNHT